MKSRFLFAIVLLATGSVYALGSKTSDKQAEPPKVKLELSVPKARLVVGEVFPIRLELHNLGTEDFYVGRYLNDESFTSPSFITLHVLDERGKGHHVDSSRYYVPSVVTYWWQVLPPAHYYGVEMTRGGPAEDVLTKPGRYTLQADYRSEGGETVAEPSQDLPWYSVWRGEITSNKITIELFESSATRSN